MNSITPDYHSSNIPTTDEHCEVISPRLKLLNLLAVIVPFIGLLAIMVMLWGIGFGWTYLGLLIGFYIATALGITIGFHRLFTHRAFETSSFMKAVFGILGSMAIQGPLLKWVADHRKHHQHTDEEGDPHSPHLHEAGVWGALKGIFHSHVGWIIWSEPVDYDRYVPDLMKERAVVVVSRLFPLWAVISLAAPAVLGGLITMSWTGVLLGFLWGGLARVFLVHHVTWSVNSVCHLWGAKEFRSHDESRNNLIVGILGMGEGWHNTHHAFPTSARHGLSWWQLDVSYWIIRFMSWIGLAWNIKVPSAATIEAKRGSARGVA